ncbi:DUF5693 family protein [Saccharibacillus sp. CPCC 101409]|uniref:DUF5693 family protein n=1 Tax=Saccharibacillus sp. CPCC 101409 TaxID=3058041 RepID=UPI002672FD47|nr:DUF5693 family protein [Saccharibacillus sp. CPCC 101409]MDO3412102.1 DUF5693 family protein [Saccharibacillus sp. CPCC 101409]
MSQKWRQWNKAAVKGLWILVILGIVASLPVAYDRIRTEGTSKNVEMIFDYRDLIQVSTYQGNPNSFIDEQLDVLKEAGINTMSVYEATLTELSNARRITVYSEQDAARLTGKVLTANENATYLLFTDAKSQAEIEPIIRKAFASQEIAVEDWELNGRAGLKIATPVQNAVLKKMEPDPISMQLLDAKGFHLLPRLGNSSIYDQEELASLLDRFKAMGVDRVLFDGEEVPGYAEEPDERHLEDFAQLLNERGIGIAAIENLKGEQRGFQTVAKLTNYNVARLYSLSGRDSALDPDIIADRFALAAKDRNIRMMFIHTAVQTNTIEGKVSDTIENIVDSLQGPEDGSFEGAMQRIENYGFEFGPASQFEVAEMAGQNYFRWVAILGAVALISILVSIFVPPLTLLAFILGIVGAAGLYVLRPHIMEQALALFAAISAPSIAMVFAIRKIDRLYDLGQQMSVGRRIVHGILLFLRTSAMSLMAVPFMIALLNRVTYQLVLEQFRGVSLLHLAPIALTALYVLFYRKNAAFGSVGRILRMPVTVAMVIIVAVVGVVGMYYLSRTGNSGSATGLEKTFRTLLENTVGVRPRFKEFLLGHPIFIAGVFVALKYRHAIYVMVIASIGQLSIVDTFAHIHTPVWISLVRDLLGMGLGIIVGLVFILVWQIIERCWRKWSPLLVKL